MVWICSSKKQIPIGCVRQFRIRLEFAFFRNKWAPSKKVIGKLCLYVSHSYPFEIVSIGLHKFVNRDLINCKIFLFFADSTIWMDFETIADNWSQYVHRFRKFNKKMALPKDDTEIEETPNAEVPAPPVPWPYMSVSSLITSLALKTAAVGLIWSWGYLNLSPGWLVAPICLAVWKSENRRNNELKRLTAQASVMAKEKQIIINRMDELPSWVYFPDFDRAEWLNRVNINLYKIVEIS